MSVYFKKGLKLAGLAVFLYYLLVYVIFPSSQQIIKKIFFRPVPANPIYGVLDPLEFIEKPFADSKPTYELNTKNGRLPNNLPTQLPVYKFKPKPFSYLGSDSAIKNAQLLGFTEKDLVSDLKGRVYKWRNSQAGTVLEIDIDTNNISQDTNLYAKAQEFMNNRIDQKMAVTQAADLLKALNKFNDTLYPSGYQNVVFGTYAGNRVVETQALSDAVVARVDFYRKIKDYTIYGPNPKKGLLSVMTRPRNTDKPILNFPRIEAVYKEIEPETKATYPLIAIEDAWAQVKDGKGVTTDIRAYGSNSFENIPAVKVERILIDNIYIAYYEPIKSVKHLQPIYVFEGKYITRGTSGGTVVIYFPAISGEWVKKVN